MIAASLQASQQLSLQPGEQPERLPDPPADGRPVLALAGPGHWQRVLADAITDPRELLEMLALHPETHPALHAGAVSAARLFRLRVPRGFVRRMRPGDPNDPLLRQVLPLDLEHHRIAGFTTDPVGDLTSRVVSGMLHKYEGRALLIATGACAVHCRYCFRRHFPYADEAASTGAWQEALQALHADASITEVILSGGDPLSLSDRKLEQLTSALQQIPHIRRLRIHTRQPVVLPERVDAGLCQWLSELPLQKVVVLHINHAQEIDDEVRAACARLTATGALLLNQSVLLAGVNDTATALADLSEALLDARVLPYYLHLLDRVQGAAHFEVGAARAQTLMAELSGRLPGFLVPRLVHEVAGAPAKMPVPWMPPGGHV